MESFDFAKGDYDYPCYVLSSSDFSPCFESNDIEHVWCYLSDLIKNGIKQFVPESAQVVQFLYKT